MNARGRYTFKLQRNQRDPGQGPKLEAPSMSCIYGCAQRVLGALPHGLGRWPTLTAIR
ncbi:hypothetical protein CBM2609_P60005 [Cupriavidus taiwanensis]|uniref:Uncharacterized protein n=2 Tax=Cupriavidus TaxID=106589 RepID=A0A375CPH1_9BURK|nr:hypothetical protein CBM2588_P70039 [Cupriavidus taiwanensis]SOZ40789.1 hypothetical protein CBM2605_P60039 [Cupriavidus neocaledonicus]SOY76990.1 hypothetical protein CBM2592_P90001 [Cupriavidus taiwanensis]SOY77287.1 hypothetical protein CBM2589_P60038 [Cupriavidus taiwanensis]SOY78224.1 hypothetical protein CBM2586_P70040 [Cupriavidus taiwanensis]